MKSEGQGFARPKGLDELGPVRVLRFEPLFVLLAAGYTLTLISLVVRLGLRVDAPTLGDLWLWLPSGLSITSAAILIGVTVRLAIPGSLPARGALFGWAAAGLGVHLATTLLTYSLSPLPPLENELQSAMTCFVMELLLGLPAGIVLVLFALRGLIREASLLGALGALATGLVGDGVWRLFCPLSQPRHVFAGHSTGILAGALVGMLLAHLLSRLLRPTPRSRTL